MKVYALKLEAAVKAHRASRRGEQGEYRRKLREVIGAWDKDRTQLRAKVRQAEADLQAAREEYQAAKTEYETRRDLWKHKIQEGIGTGDDLPRFTDEIKKLAYEDYQSGASYSTIRVALGTATLDEAKVIVAEGQELTEGW